MPDLLTTLAITAAVLMVAALTSRLVERTPLSFPMVFLGLGFALGQHGLRLLHVGPRDPALEVVGALSLSFVLFLDAINLRFKEPGQDWRVPLLSLGPGTLATVAIISAGAALLLGLPLLESLLLGAVLSSVDPVLLRDVLRDERIPRSLRQSLKIEAGANDMIVLPLVLVLAAVARHQAGSVVDWTLFLVRLFALGPLAGAAVGWGSVWLMDQVRRRMPVSREYRALYGVGTVLASYAAGEAMGGSGFLAVFASGIVVAALDYDLCDCFLEYGETTSEMTMLLAFLLFGAMLSPLIAGLAFLPALAFGAYVLLIARPLAITLVLRRASLSRRARAFIGWFGPRGLSSLLFAQLLIADGVPGAESLLGSAGMVVVLSVIAHGISALPLASGYERAAAREVMPEEREGSAAGLFQPDAADAPRITPAELAELLARPDPPIVLDVRAQSSYDPDGARIPGSVRVAPGDVAEWAAGQAHDRSVVAYCT